MAIGKRIPELVQIATGELDNADFLAVYDDSAALDVKVPLSDIYHINNPPPGQVWEQSSTTIRYVDPTITVLQLGLSTTPQQLQRVRAVYTGGNAILQLESETEQTVVNLGTWGVRIGTAASTQLASSIAPIGANTDINLELRPKGAGRINTTAGLSVFAPDAYTQNLIEARVNSNIVAKIDAGGLAEFSQLIDLRRAASFAIRAFYPNSSGTGAIRISLSDDTAADEARAIYISNQAGQEAFQFRAGDGTVAPTTVATIGNSGIFTSFNGRYQLSSTGLAPLGADLIQQIRNVRDDEFGRGIQSYMFINYSNGDVSGNQARIGYNVDDDHFFFWFQNGSPARNGYQAVVNPAGSINPEDLITREFADANYSSGATSWVVQDGTVNAEYVETASGRGIRANVDAAYTGNILQLSQDGATVANIANNGNYQTYGGPGLQLYESVGGQLAGNIGIDTVNKIYRFQGISPTGGDVPDAGAYQIEFQLRNVDKPIVFDTKGNTVVTAITEWWHNTPYTTGTKHLVGRFRKTGGQGQFGHFEALNTGEVVHWLDSEDRALKMYESEVQRWNIAASGNLRMKGKDNASTGILDNGGFDQIILDPGLGDIRDQYTIGERVEFYDGNTQALYAGNITSLGLSGSSTAITTTRAYTDNPGGGTVVRNILAVGDAAQFAIGTDVDGAVQLKVKGYGGNVPLLQLIDSSDKKLFEVTGDSNFPVVFVDGDVQITEGLNIPIADQAGYQINFSKNGTNGGIARFAGFIDGADTQEVLINSSTGSAGMLNVRVKTFNSSQRGLVVTHIGGAGSPFSIQTGTGGREVFRVDNIGGVIVQRSVETDGAFLSLRANIGVDGNTIGTIAWYNDATAGDVAYIRVQRQSESFNAGMSFWTRSGSTPLERMTINASGNVFMYALPTSNPNVAGALWNNGGVVNISAG